MRTLSSEHRGLLFDKVQEVIQQAGLTEKERIPKYRSVLAPKCQTHSRDDEQMPVAVLPHDEASRSYLTHLYNDKFDPTQTVGVITPFRAQIAQIRKLLNGAYTDVTVDTVERFQGSERDVILVSFAVKSPLQLRAIQSINAEGVDRKLNVAKARAKEFLGVLGVEEVVGGLVPAVEHEITQSKNLIVS